jgi:membrane protein DedA with SNARE-associated domain
VLPGLFPLAGAVLSDAGLGDPQTLDRVLQWSAGISPHWLYIALAAGVAIENFFPPIPADTFVAFGAFISAQGRITGLGVFLVTWTMNTAGALLSYGLARRWGRSVLGTRAGRWLLRPRQLEKLAALYNAHGSKMIFASRFLPAFRALVPVFGGITHLAFWRTVLPVAAASAVWYGVLVYLGAALGRNWQAVLDTVSGVSTLLLVIAAAVGAVVVAVWWRTRHHTAEMLEERER